MIKNSYLETLYNEKKRPLQTYPKKLIGYLIKRFNLEKQQKILEIGCGRGEFLNEFALYGLEAHGVDLSDYCLNFFQIQKNFIQVNFMVTPEPKVFL